MKVCVIGAGASGLTSIKACKEENVDVICYESSSWLGGLWRYDDSANATTVTRTTIINSSKEMSSFSDFPAPSHYPNYFHHSLMLKYLQLYAEEFDLARHIRYRSEVVRVSAADQVSSTRWTVSVRNLETGEVKREDFDSVMVCTGHLNRPIKATFKNQHKFRGEIMHAQAYKKPDGFEGKRVCLVGIGNSSVDASIDLSLIAEKVFLSTRRGGWVVSRVGPGGQPIDSYFLRRLTNLVFQYLPIIVSSAIFETIVQSQFDHRLYGLQPNYRIFNAHPTVNDMLPNRLISGTVILKSDIDRFEENGVVFKGEDAVTPLDCLILGTGYEMEFPFLDQQIVQIDDNRPGNLYKLQYVLEQPHTLAFIGLIQPNGPLLPISELQARWHLQLLTGKCKGLPTCKRMRQDIKRRENALKCRYYDSKRHTIGVDVIPFMDEVASQFDAKPNLFKLFFTDPVLWYACLFKPSLPYAYRLKGPHSNYQKSRAAILGYQQRVRQAFETRDYDYGPAGLFSRMVAGLLTVLVAVILLFF